MLVSYSVYFGSSSLKSEGNRVNNFPLICLGVTVQDFLISSCFQMSIIIYVICGPDTVSPNNAHNHLYLCELFVTTRVDK